MHENRNLHRTIFYGLSRVALRRRLKTGDRRKGFMAFGLILCLILIFTVAAVLWSYQYFAIQNLELECAVRSALSAAAEDGTLEKYLRDSGAVASTSGSNESGLENSTLQKVLDLTVAQQNRGFAGKSVKIKVAKKAANGEKPILGFSQSRELGFTRGSFDNETRKKAEGTVDEPEKFIQYYEISTDGTSFKKVYSITNI